MIHVWDRGFASSAWLGQAIDQKVRFIVRWPTKYKLQDANGLRNAWKITRGKRSVDPRLIWDNRRKCYGKTGIVFAPVRHRDYDMDLWLVVSQPGKGRKPWYLLTTEPIENVDDAWRIVFSYARRWQIEQIEMSYRYQKTELAMESPRLWRWENRLKLLLMATLVYAFLLSLLDLDAKHLIDRLLRTWCHRTGKRYRTAAIPLYRLRSAISRLWMAIPPPQPDL